MKHCIVIVTTAFLLLFSERPLQAGLESNEGSFKNPDVFGIRFDQDEREFYGRVSAINSVSLQRYQTSHFLVSEMNIDFNGSATQLRIFHAQPLKGSDLRDRAQEALPPGSPNIPDSSIGQGMVDRANQTASRAANQVLRKQYPTTTHARTVEFQVKSLQGLEELFQQVRNGWIGADGRDFATSDNQGETKLPDPNQNQLAGTLFVFSDKD